MIKVKLKSCPVMHFDKRWHCRTTLVCDSDMEAKTLAQGRDGQERHKVVTKQGLLYSKSGAMTGGGAESMAKKKAQLNEAESVQAREVRHWHTSRVKTEVAASALLHNFLGKVQYLGEAVMEATGC